MTATITYSGPIQFRNGIASAWTAANPILLPGEMGVETDTAKFKIGDGVTAWTSLSYGGLVGPQGPTGTTGATGPTGATGATGPAGSPTSVGPVGSTPNANAAVISGSTLNLEPASTAYPGVMLPADKIRGQQVYDAAADFGFVGDHQVYFDGAASTSTPNKITSATAAFTTNAVIGQRVTLAGAGSGGAVYVGTISSIDSATQIGVSPNISTTVSARGLQFGTDNTNAITAMQNAVNVALTSYAGVKIVFGDQLGLGARYSNRFGFPALPNFNRPPTIEGIGGGYSEDGGDYTRAGGTCWAWWGSSSDGGTAFSSFLTVAPASGGFHLDAPRLAHFWLDCRNGDQNQALMGLKQLSNAGFEVEDFFICDPLAIGVYQNVASSLVSGDARDVTRGDLSKIRVRALDAGINNVGGAITTAPTTTTSAITLSTTGQSLVLAAANGLSPSGYIWVMTNLGYPVLCNYTGGGGTTTLTGLTCSAADAINAPATVSGSNVVQACPANAGGFIFDGDTTANSCCSYGKNWLVSHGTTWGPAAITHRNSDSWEVHNPVLNGGNATNLGAINRVTKPGVVFCGSNTNATLAARNNTYRGGSPGAGGVVGLGVNNAGTLLSAASGPNYWDLQQLGNGEPVAVREANSAGAGASLMVTYNGAFQPGSAGTAAAAAQTAIANARTVIAGTVIPVPPQGSQAGTRLRWEIDALQTATAAVQGPIIVHFGSTGTSSDTAVATFTLPTGTASTATGLNMVIDLTIRTVPSPVGAGATAYATLKALQSTAAGNFGAALSALIQGTMATFNTSGQNYWSVSYLSAAAGATLTPQMAHAECRKPANP